MTSSATCRAMAITPIDSGVAPPFSGDTTPGAPEGRSLESRRPTMAPILRTAWNATLAREPPPPWQSRPGARERGQVGAGQAGQDRDFDLA